MRHFLLTLVYEDTEFIQGITAESELEALQRTRRWLRILPSKKLLYVSMVELLETEVRTIG